MKTDTKMLDPKTAMHLGAVKTLLPKSAGKNDLNSLHNRDRLYLPRKHANTITIRSRYRTKLNIIRLEATFGLIFISVFGLKGVCPFFRTNTYLLN